MSHPSTATHVYWSRLAFWVSLILLAFVVGRCLAPSGQPSVSEAEHERLQEDLLALAERNLTLESELRQLQSETGEPAEIPPGPTIGDVTPRDPFSPPTPLPPEVEEPPAEEEEESASTPESRTYVVQPGDTLAMIAQEFYGDMSDAALIIEANDIEQVDQIAVGEVLEIPPDPDATESQADAQSVETETESEPGATPSEEWLEEPAG